MPMVIDIDGSSTVIRCNGFGSSGSESVSPIVISGIPAIATMSPRPRRFGGLSVQCVGHQQLRSLTVRIVPSARHQATF